MTDRTADEIREHVRNSYASRVRPVLEATETIQTVSAGDACCGPDCCSTDAEATTVTMVSAAAEACCDVSAGDDCCGPSTGSEESLTRIEALYQGTDTSDLASSITDVAFGCGNPTAIAALQPGQIVLDLGSGGGIDCFLAAKMVGDTGRVYGVDMTPEMIALSRKNAGKVGATNVEFRLGEIEHLPIGANEVDVVISNCVINLSPDKDQVFRDAFRVLKPGGRMQVSDIVWTKPVPDAIKQDMDEWAGCIAGAMLESEYVAAIERAGFERVTSEAAEYAGREGVASAAVVAYKPV
jgi:ubiquinone/menaquinone biosynthesis C-methylase UbiE